MKRLNFLGLLASLITVVSLSCETQSRTDWMTYFPLAVGNEWNYHNHVESAASRDEKITVKVTGTTTLRNAQCYILEIVTDGELTIREFLHVDEAGLFTYKQEMKGSSRDFEPALHRLRFPLTMGKTWTWEGNVPGVGQATFKYKVEGKEEVQVPAGKFNTIKVVTTTFETDLLRTAESMRQIGIDTEVEPACVDTEWLAKDVGVVKKTLKVLNVLITSQLKSYSLTHQGGKKKETAKSLSFSVTDVVQKSDYSVIYVNIDPMEANLPWALSRETIHAVNKEGVKIPMEGAALRKTIVFGLSAFTISLDEEGGLSFEIPESDEVQLLFVLPRKLKEFEIALAFKAKKEGLVSLDIAGIGIARWSQY